MTRDEALLRLRSDLESGFDLKFPRFDLLLSVLPEAEVGPPPPLVMLNPHLKNLFDFVMSLKGISSGFIGTFCTGRCTNQKRPTIARQGWGPRHHHHSWQ
jgi:hypothetical protein